MAPELTEVGPGVFRRADGLVNWYLVREGDSVALYDAGWPRSWSGIEEAIRSVGGSLEAIVLTHGHPDHLGAAEKARKATGVPVHAHAPEVARVRGKASGSSPFTLVPGLVPWLYKPSALGFVLHATARGFMTPTWVDEVQPFVAGAPLDVPGRPRAVETPGHTEGHVSFVLAGAGVVITGDALASYDPLSGDEGPRILPDALNGDPDRTRASLTVLEGLDAGTLLFGHGEPFLGAPADAVAQARERLGER
jgi:glyoxylase-like metal-dependent hydrolase (beta-lactamase superfamily II)